MKLLRLLPLLLLGIPAAGSAFTPDCASLVAVPPVTLPLARVQDTLARTVPSDRPFQFAVAVPGGYGLADGRWDVADGLARWRLRLASANAVSLSLHLQPFELPPGASLWIYDGACTTTHGPYTASQRTPSGLWTPLVPGGELVLEARMPVAEASTFRVGIASAHHGFRDWKAGTQEAGTCNVDVACSQADPWRSETRSVARIQVGGQYLCSGQLLNNVRQDLTPFFITADHCKIGDPEGGPADSVVFYWNYQASQCGGARDGSLSDTQTGSTFLADDVTADFTLVRLLQAPPQDYDVYYAGWNVTGSGSDHGVAIHHPSGAEKAISVYSTPVSRSRATIEGDRTVEAWQVEWSAGTTEPGSSGAGLWNADHQVIGVLSGGSASCSNTSGNDFFGRLDAAWTAGAAADEQLKAHLDPDNTCAGAVPGRDPDESPGQIDYDVRVCGSPASGSGGYSLGWLMPALLLVLAAGALARRL